MGVRSFWTAVKNPYHDIVEPEEIRITRRWACVLISLFLAVCVVPPVWRNLAALGEEGGWVPVVKFWHDQALEVEGLAAHLKAFEDELEKAFFAEAARQRIQLALVRWMGEGNTKTHIGEDGWLYFRPAMDAVTGSGPIRKPELGAASDPALKRWQPPLPVIKRFAEQLRERGIQLLLVPVPVKPMVYPEMLADRTFREPLTHPDAEAFYAELRQAGVEVLDLAPLFWQLKAQGEVFLRQDTHWRPAAMRAAAAAVAAQVPDALRGDPARFALEPLARTHIGDLVQKLDLPEDSSAFSPERAVLEKIIDTTTGQRPGSDRSSPVVLLGDSFVNIFDSGDLGFGTGVQDELIGAGFAQHLAAQLGRSLDVIAKNGQASTQVRADLAERPDDEVRAKKLVIWVIASRDLFYSAKAAMANNVVWEDVTWSERSSSAPRPSDSLIVPDEGVLVEATLAEAAAVPDPDTLNYASGTYETRWEGVQATDGSGALDELFVRLWAFRDKEPVPTATAAAGGTLEPGRRYRFLVTPLYLNEAADSAQVQELEKQGFPEIYFAETVEPAA